MHRVIRPLLLTAVEGCGACGWNDKRALLERSSPFCDACGLVFSVFYVCSFILQRQWSSVSLARGLYWKIRGCALLELKKNKHDLLDIQLPLMPLKKQAPGRFITTFLFIATDIALPLVIVPVCKQSGSWLDRCPESPPHFLLPLPMSRQSSSRLAGWCIET